MTKEKKVLADYPAYTIVETDDTVRYQCRQYGMIKSDVPIMIELPAIRGGTIWTKFIPGSLVSYAMRYHECPIKALERRENHIADPSNYTNHPLWWINRAPTILSDSPPAKITLDGYHIGDHVWFEGRVFELAHASNRNVQLIELGEV